MIKPTSNHSYLWNSLPKDERTRLMPYQIESQILHLWQARQVLINNHNRTLQDIDEWIASLRRGLADHERVHGVSPTSEESR